MPSWPGSFRTQNFSQNPQSTTAKRPIFLKAEKVDVNVIGANWNEANAEAEKFLKDHPEAFFVHPFEQESTWQGHSTIVHEIKDQLRDNFGFEESLGALVTCVGGGGLAIGTYAVDCFEHHYHDFFLLFFKQESCLVWKLLVGT